MENLFVTFEIAMKLKDKGFNEPCITTFFNKELAVKNHRIGNLYFDKINSELIDHYSMKHHECSAPTYDQVINWFREKHNMIIQAVLESYSLRAFKELGEPRFKFKGYFFCFNRGEDSAGVYDTKEEALHNAILKSLELI